MNLIKMVKPDFESENKRKIKIHSKIKQLANVTKEEFEIYNDISVNREKLDISVSKEHSNFYLWKEEAIKTIKSNHKTHEAYLEGAKTNVYQKKF